MGVQSRLPRNRSFQLLDSYCLPRSCRLAARCGWQVRGAIGSQLLSGSVSQSLSGLAGQSAPRLATSFLARLTADQRSLNDESTQDQRSSTMRVPILAAWTPEPAGFPRGLLLRLGGTTAADPLASKSDRSGSGVHRPCSSARAGPRVLGHHREPYLEQVWHKGCSAMASHKGLPSDHGLRPAMETRGALSVRSSSSRPRRSHRDRHPVGSRGAGGLLRRSVSPMPPFA